MTRLHHTCCLCDRHWWALRPHRTIAGRAMCPTCTLDARRTYGDLNRAAVERWATNEYRLYGESAGERIRKAGRVLAEDENRRCAAGERQTTTEEGAA